VTLHVTLTFARYVRVIRPSLTQGYANLFLSLKESRPVNVPANEREKQRSDPYEVRKWDEADEEEIQFIIKT